MPAPPAIANILTSWRTVLGTDPTAEVYDDARSLWRVTAGDGTKFMLKRLEPWRNLPLADEARVVQFVASQGIPVAEFEITDDARLFAGGLEEPFVLLPLLRNDHLLPDEIMEMEPVSGCALARLHQALASYPRSANSYHEDLAGALTRELMLPPALSHLLDPYLEPMISLLREAPIQLIHGDMTPENVLVRAPNAISGFIDFDHLPCGPRIWDIGKYLSRRIRLRWRAGSAPNDQDRLIHIRRFMAGYHGTRSLSTIEIDALPFTILAANVIESSYFAEISAGLLERRMLPDHDEVLADSLEAVDWHVRHVAEVTAAVRAGVARGD